jgi:hypothetical protein
MFCDRTKGGATQATAGEFQEETRNRDATVRTQQKGTNINMDKTNKNGALP